MARGFGAGSPLLLASEYGLIDKTFFESLTPTDKIFIDHALLNRIIEAENEAQRAAHEEASQKSKMPGLKRIVSAKERSEQLREMKNERHRFGIQGHA